MAESLASSRRVLATSSPPDPRTDHSETPSAHADSRRACGLAGQADEPILDRRGLRVKPHDLVALRLVAISPNFSSVGLASIRRSSVEKCEINYVEPAQNSMDDRP